MSLHDDIMNLPHNLDRYAINWSEDEQMAYKLGHRDARHAAAKLTLKADAEREEMIEIFKWLANNPGMHIGNATYTAKQMLKKIGEL